MKRSLLCGPVWKRRALRCSASALTVSSRRLPRRSCFGASGSRREAQMRRRSRPWNGGCGASWEAFIALAAYVALQSGWMLWTAAEPGESLVGIILAAASLVIMPLVACGKLRAARELGSGALRAEAKETLACSYLSFALLLGLAANAAAGWWWADPVAALLMVPWLVKEGREGLRGEGCCG